MKPLTMNGYNLKDSFDAVTRSQNIPENLFRDNFDVSSLFTSVPLKKTIHIILDSIYNKELISTSLKKRTLKKLLLDSCTKPPFQLTANSKNGNNDLDTNAIGFRTQISNTIEGRRKVIARKYTLR